MATGTMTESTQKARPFNFINFSNKIDGKLSPTRVTRHSINPATLQPNPEVPLSTEADADVAVSAARRAFGHWSKTTAAERKRAVLAYADDLEEYKIQFAELLTQEQGKPVHDIQYISTMCSVLTDTNDHIVTSYVFRS
jgi:acyl-CoA reductase-like NAD-dependent aldehyde dehydrogenase